MRIIFTIFCCLHLLCGQSQSSLATEFTADLGLIPRDMASSPDGHVYVLAMMEDAANFVDGVLILKYHPSDGLKWSKRLGPASQRIRPASIKLLENGDLLVGMDIYGGPLGSVSMGISRLTGGGTHLWSRAVGRTNGTSELDAMVELSDGSLILAGNAEDNSGFQDWYFVKTNAQGQMLNNFFAGASHYEYLNDLTLGPDNQLYAVGRTSSFSPDQSNEGAIIVTDTAFSTLDAFRIDIPNSSQEIFHRVESVPGQGILLAGQFQSEHHYAFWDGQANALALRQMGNGEAAGIFPLGSGQYWLYTSQGLLYAADDQDGYQFGFYQDNPDLGTGNRASAILPDRQLAFSGMNQVNGQRVLSLIFSAPDLAPACSGYYSSPVDTAHRSRPLLPLTISAAANGSDMPLNWSVTDVNVTELEVCRQQCSGAPDASFSTQVSGLQVSLGLDAAYNTDTSNIYWLLDGQSIRDITQLNYTFGAAGSYEICAVVQTSCGSDTVCQTVDLLTTSLPTVQSDPSLLAWPIPAKDILTVEWPGNQVEQVQVFDAKGTLIRLSAKGNADQWEIDVRSLPGGLYHLLVHSEEGALASKRMVVSN